ncbi:hypothetical protein [Azospirillum sp. sgz301742]
MILETRELVFTNTALKKAFEWYAKVPNQGDLPPGAITSVSPKPGGAVTLLVQQSGTSKNREVAFTASKTMAVLLYFCRKQRIPIPRDAEKDIATKGDTISLTISGQTRTVSP